MKKIGLVLKPGTEAIPKADEFEKWLVNKGHEVVWHQSTLPNGQPRNKTNSAAPKDLFCVFVLGGDGTFLSAVRWIGDQDTPILGIKFGELGFLAEATEDSLYSTAENVLNSEFTTKHRMRLLVTVFREGKEIAR